MTRLTAPIFLALPIMLVNTAALAQPGLDCLDQRFRPSFEPRSLEFGVDVAISDEHLLVVDRFSQALIYTYRRDASGAWVLSQTVPGGGGGDVVLDGDRFMTGEPRIDPDGGALIYEFDGNEWNEVAELPIGPGRSSPWGEHVSFTVGRAAIGNAGEDVVIFRDAGGDQWEFVEEIMSPDSPDERSDFGDALAMDERFLFVGAPGEDITGGQNGAIYVYEWGVGGRPMLMQKIEPEPEDFGPRLGTSLALQGNTLVAGAWAYERDDTFAGAAYIYEYDGAQWSLRHRIVGESAPPTATFGWDVSIDGGVVAVGAITDFVPGASGVGAAYLYRQANGGPWTHTATIAPAVSARDYGESLNLGGGQLAIGASESFVGGFEHGLAEVYDLDCLICTPDLDADGVLTVFDFLAFFNLFQDGDARADFDGDGELTIFDFLAFQTAFDAGCP
jgi:hypothetical protein